MLSNEQIQGNILEQNNDLKPPMSLMKVIAIRKKTEQDSTAPSSVIGELTSSAKHSCKPRSIASRSRQAAHCTIALAFWPLQTKSLEMMKPCSAVK